MKKMERGVSDSRGDKKVSAVKWNDNQCVVVATNYADVTDKDQALELQCQETCRCSPADCCSQNFTMLIWEVSTSLTGFCLTTDP